MKDAYLKVSYRKGRPFAAYYYLSRARERSHRTEVMPSGLLVDFDQDGRPLGIEILDPRGVSVRALNELLRSFGFDAVTSAEVNELRAA